MDTLCLNKTDGMQLIRHNMIDELMKKGLNSRTVLEAMASVPRHVFVSDAFKYRAYDDISLPIGFGQTVSKPSVIGRMVQSLGLSGTERVMEIGTGSGYQSAVLAGLAREVVTLERINELYVRAGAVLWEMNYRNVYCVNTGDFNDVDDCFDAIVVAAGADVMPVDILNKLKPGGRVVIPVCQGDNHCIKRYLLREDGSVLEEEIGEAVFVPLIMD